MTRPPWDADEPQSVSLSPKHRGYKRIVGELNGLGISVCATSVRKVLLRDVPSIQDKVLAALTARLSDD
jgi:hypothetical protein